VFALTGAECRGYRIAGVGAVFVLPPRAVRSRGVVVWRQVQRPSRLAPPDRQLRVVELQAEELQREAARTHAEVERALAAVQREIERRRAAPARVAAAEPSAPEAPLPPEAPPGPLPPPPAVAPLPPAPPWSLWLEAGDLEEQEAATEAVIGRMRAALVEALAAHAAAIGLRGDETLAAAIDFVPSLPLGSARPDRTLVLRVRKKDLDERRAGRIDADQLKARIEAAEY
jgi:hypothetical protein